MIKICSKCKFPKDTNEFAFNRSTSDGLQSWCKECFKSTYPARNKRLLVRSIAGVCRNHPTIPTNGQSRCQLCKWKEEEHRLNVEYNITLEEYAWLEYKQDRKCAICHKMDIRSLSLDHNHNTLDNRSLLCMYCNVGLKNFKEDINILYAAILYLERWSTHGTSINKNP